MKEGDRVKLNIKSQYYIIGVDDDPNHPKSVVGDIYHIGGDGLIFVEWPTGVKSVYSKPDLDIQSHLPPIPVVGCTCDSWEMYHFGCKCAGGQEELERERK